MEKTYSAFDDFLDDCFVKGDSICRYKQFQEDDNLNTYNFIEKIMESKKAL